MHPGNGLSALQRFGLDGRDKPGHNEKSKASKRAGAVLSVGNDFRIVQAIDLAFGISSRAQDRAAVLPVSRRCCHWDFLRTAQRKWAVDCHEPGVAQWPQNAGSCGLRIIHDLRYSADDAEGQA